MDLHSAATSDTSPTPEASSQSAPNDERTNLRGPSNSEAHVQVPAADMDATDEHRVLLTVSRYVDFYNRYVTSHYMVAYLDNRKVWQSTKIAGTNMWPPALTTIPIPDPKLERQSLRLHMFKKGKLSRLNCNVGSVRWPLSELADGYPRSQWFDLMHKSGFKTFYRVFCSIQMLKPHEPPDPDVFQYPLHRFIETGNHTWVLRFLRQCKEDALDMRDNHRRRPLATAVQCGDIESVNAIIKRAGREACARVIMEDNILHMAVGTAEPPPFEVLTRLVQDAEQPNQADVRLLNAANDQQQTPIHAAASSGTSAMVKWLIEAGADPEVFDKLSNSPLDLAIRRITAPRSPEDVYQMVLMLSGVTHLGTCDLFNRSVASRLAITALTPDQESALFEAFNVATRREFLLTNRFKHRLLGEKGVYHLKSETSSQFRLVWPEGGESGDQTPPADSLASSPGDDNRPTPSFDGDSMAFLVISPAIDSHMSAGLGLVCAKSRNPNQQQSAYGPNVMAVSGAGALEISGRELDEARTAGESLILLPYSHGNLAETLRERNHTKASITYQIVIYSNRVIQAPVLIPPLQYNIAIEKGEWTREKSGGAPNGEMWRENPTYRVRIVETEPPIERAVICVRLQQSSPNAIGDFSEILFLDRSHKRVEHPLSVGIVAWIEPSRIIATSEDWANSRDVLLNTELRGEDLDIAKASNLCITPTTYQAGQIGEYQLQISSNVRIQLVDST